MPDDHNSITERLGRQYKDLLGQVGKVDRSEGPTLGDSLHPEDRRDPGPINPTSFLMIKAFNGDNGKRPIDPEWTRISPSITFLSPDGSSIQTMAEFRAVGADKVSVGVVVDNLGGIDVPSAKVAITLHIVWGAVTENENPEKFVSRLHGWSSHLISAWVPTEGNACVLWDHPFLPIKYRDLSQSPHDDDQLEVKLVDITAEVYSLSPRDYYPYENRDHVHNRRCASRSLE